MAASPAVLTIDEHGFVVDYPTLYRRLLGALAPLSSAVNVLFAELLSVRPIMIIVDHGSEPSGLA